MALKNMGPTSNEEIKFIYEKSPWDDENVREPEGDFIITGRLLPNSDIYKEGSIKTEIILGTQFPGKPPRVVLKTKIYHPNVDEKGKETLIIKYYSI
jgi:ubiquitin-protein ligase